MTLTLFSRRSTARSAIRSRDRRVTGKTFALRPGLDALEARLVLSQGGVTAPIAVPAQVAAHPSANVSVPINVTGINLTSVTRDATTGVLTAVGNLTGTLLGHSFTTPLTATITPAADPTTCPVLNLHLGPINLNLLGLNVATSPICLNVTATHGGGLLGDLLCGGLTTALGDAASAASSAASSGLPIDLSGVLNDLNSLLGGSSVLGGLNSALGGLTAGFAPTMSPAATNILHLSLGPVDLSLLGLNVHLDNCSGGPVTVDVTATPGNGQLLGNLLSSLDNLLNNPGNPIGGILSHVDQILGLVTCTPPAV